MSVELRFDNIDDFHPERVAQQVQPLRELIKIRQQLSSLLAKTDGNDELSEKLRDIISNTEMLQKLKAEAGLEEPGSDGAASTEEGSG